MITVLVAEDDLIMQQLVVFKLKQQGFTVVTATDGEAALAMAERERPDLVLLDCMMPILDGFEVLRRLKETPELAQIPVVMLTARGKDHDVVTGLELGAADYIVKPVSPPELMARIKRLLRDKLPGT